MDNLITEDYLFSAPKAIFFGPFYDGKLQLWDERGLIGFRRHVWVIGLIGVLRSWL